MTASETKPLLGSPNKKKLTNSGNDSNLSNSTCVKIHKHITLTQAIMIMVGCCSGAGIFVSPTGVLANIGSIGGSLIIWAVCGIINMVLALCYAELGSAIPIAGGDYAYINYVLGPFPAFLCLWVLVILAAPSAAAIMGRTVGTYLATLVGLECNVIPVVLVAAFVVGKWCLYL